MLHRRRSVDSPFRVLPGMRHGSTRRVAPGMRTPVEKTVQRRGKVFLSCPWKLAVAGAARESAEEGET